VERAAKDLAVRGDLRVRPIMMGPGYTAVAGRLATTAAVVAGYAFSRITLVATRSRVRVTVPGGVPTRWSSRPV
jgi:hypothetical protein